MENTYDTNQLYLTTDNSNNTLPPGISPSELKVPLEGFLSSLYVNFALLVIILFAISLLRRVMPEFFMPRSFSVDDRGAAFRMALPKRERKKAEELSDNNLESTRMDGQGPPLIPDRWLGHWFWFIYRLPIRQVLNTVGLDTYMLLRFTQRASQMFGVVCVVFACGVLLPLNVKYGTLDLNGFDSLSLSNVDTGQPILWTHAVSVWLFSLSAMGILIEIGREYATVRHRYLRYNMYHRTTLPSEKFAPTPVTSPEASHSPARPSTLVPATTGQPVARANVSFFGMNTDDTQIAHSMGSDSLRTGDIHLRDDSLSVQTPLESSMVRYHPNSLAPPWIQSFRQHKIPRRMRPAYQRHPRPYTVVVENLPAWVASDTQLYWLFDMLFPGEVANASIVTRSEDVDNARDDRDETIRLLERAEHLRRTPAEETAAVSLQTPLSDTNTEIRTGHDPERSSISATSEQTTTGRPKRQSFRTKDRHSNEQRDSKHFQPISTSSAVTTSNSLHTCSLPSAAPLPSDTPDSTNLNQMSSTPTSATPLEPKHEVDMVLWPVGLQSIVDFVFCGPFYEQILGGCYRTCCRCCDDGRNREQDVYQQIDSEISQQNARLSTPIQPEVGAPLDSPISRPKRGCFACCLRPGRRIDAFQYLERKLTLDTLKLMSLRERAGTQRRRRASFSGSQSDSTSSGANSSTIDSTNDKQIDEENGLRSREGSLASLVTSGGATQSVDQHSTEKTHARRRTSQAPSSVVSEAEGPLKRPRASITEPAPSTENPRHPPTDTPRAFFNMFGRSVAGVGKNVFDRVAYTTEMLMGVDWRSTLKSRQNAKGFRPTCTGFVTFKTLAATSVASQMRLVPLAAVQEDHAELHRRGRAPTLSPDARSVHPRNRSWSGHAVTHNNGITSDLVEFAETVKGGLLAPFTAVGDVLDMSRQPVLTAYRAPGPEDVHWSNIYEKPALRQSRWWTTFWIKLVLQFFYTIPVSAASSLVTVENLQQVIPGLDSLLASSSFLRGVVAGFLPTLVLEIFIALLPMVYRFLASYEYIPTHSGIEIKAACGFFQFKAWQLMFVFTVTGTVFDSLDTIINQPTAIIQMLGVSLPRLSAFFVNFLMLRSLTLFPLAMLRPFPLLLHYVKYRRGKVISRQGFRRLFSVAKFKRKQQKKQQKAQSSLHTWQLWNMTRREYWENVLLSGGEFDWVQNFTDVLVAFLIAITYSSLNPVIAPIGALFFFNATFAIKYMTLYVHHKSWETGGLLWPRIARRVIVCLLVYQCTMIGILGLKRSPSSAAVVPLLFITIWFNSFIKSTLEEPAEFLSLQECREIDAVDRQHELRHEKTSSKEPKFSTYESLKNTRFPPDTLVMCTNSAYVRPSLLGRKDLRVGKISTKQILYY